MRRLMLWCGIILAVLGVLGGCSPGDSPKAGSSPTYRLPGRAARVAETPLPYRPAADGLVTFAVIGIRDKMEFITGTHADMPARGAFVRVRVIIDNGYPHTQTFDTAKQLLVTADGRTQPPDIAAMEVERQPGKIDIGAHDRLELDLYYDIPKNATPRAIHLYGQPTDDGGNPIEPDRGVQVPLR